MIPLLNEGSKPPIWIWLIVLVIFATGIWIDTRNILEFLTLFSIPLIITVINIIYWKNHG